MKREITLKGGPAGGGIQFNADVKDGGVINLPIILGSDDPGIFICGNVQFSAPDENGVSTYLGDSWKGELLKGALPIEVPA